METSGEISKYGNRKPAKKRMKRRVEKQKLTGIETEKFRQIVPANDLCVFTSFTSFKVELVGVLQMCESAD